MIQRIQSIYLTLAILLSLFLFSSNIFSFRDESGKVFNFLTDGSITDQAGQIFTKIDNSWPISLILILIAVLSLITILLFKNRKIQLKLALSVIVLSAGLIIALAIYASIVTHAFRLSIVPGLKMAFPFLLLVFSILAYRGILRDDRLVKSYDRLR